MKEQESTDRLLRRNRRALESQVPGGACLDAETIAAWSSGSLPADLRAAAESHAADCSRCLGILAALAQTEPEPAPVSWAGWLPLRWLVPVTAAATAVLLWVMVERPPDQADLSGAPAEQVAKSQESLSERVQQPTTPPASPSEAFQGRRSEAEPPARRDVPAPPPPAPAAPSAPERLKSMAPPPPAAADAAAGDAQERTRAAQERTEQAETFIVPPAAATPGAAAERRSAAVRVVPDPTSGIVSPDPAFRWRIAGTAMERSVDGGRTWHRQETGATVPLRAGSAPSPTVCWVAGDSGTILLSTDGEAWTRVAFPEVVDLVAIVSTGAQTAAVTTADGRTFQTADGGRTWALQEGPAAPF